jgi:hypothetical protein
VRLRVVLIFTILCISATSAKAVDRNDAFFDAVKVYSEKVLVLNDFIEFSEFDMSEIKFENDTAPLLQDPNIVTPSMPVPSGQGVLAQQPQAGGIAFDALGEVRSVLDKLPQDFYAGLKREIYRNKLPVTLYPKDAPSFAKPLKFYVKIKKIHILPYVIQKNGDYQQPVELRIYAQLTDKATDQVILKYYDAETAMFTLGKNQAGDAFAGAAQKMMRDFVVYLKTRY